MQIEIRLAKVPLAMFDADLPQQRLVGEGALFLHAFDESMEPVAQISFWCDGVMWWGDHFAIVPAYRGGNLRYEMLNCMHHVALQLGVVTFLAEIRRNGKVSFDTFVRDADRFPGIGQTIKLVRETEKHFVVERDLRQLEGAVKRGEVPLIVLPYCFEYLSAETTQIEVQLHKERLFMFDAELPQQQLAPEGALFLRATVKNEPVGQICFWHDGVVWWGDHFAIVEKYRGTHLRAMLLHCLHHLALQLGVTSFYSEIRKKPTASWESFQRGVHKFGVDIMLKRETQKHFVIETDLTQLRDAVGRNETQCIAFPYRFELPR